MPAFTQEYENIPEHRVNREMTLEYAMFELATKLQEIKERAHGVTPLFSVPMSITGHDLC